MDEQSWVFIIESVSPEDLLVNRTEGRLLLESLRLAGLKVQYRLAVNRSTFASALAEFASAVENQKQWPMLHLSAHGNQKGIGLTTGDFLEWKSLRDMLILVNKVCRDFLFLSLSSCSGGLGYKMAMNDLPDLPFKGLLAHHGEKVDFSSAAIAFTVFYHRLARQDAFDVAVAAMCAAVGDDQYHLIEGPTARNIYNKAVQDVLAELASEREGRSFK